MKSVGEAMSIGRNFTEAFGKVLRSLETKRAGYWTGPEVEGTLEELLEAIKVPTDGRMYQIAQAFGLGATLEQLFDATAIDPWFLDQMQQIVELGAEVRSAETFGATELRFAKHTVSPTARSRRCGRSSSAKGRRGRTPSARCVTS